MKQFTSCVFLFIIGWHCFCVFSERISEHYATHHPWSFGMAYDSVDSISITWQTFHTTRQWRETKRIFRFFVDHFRWRKTTPQLVNVLLLLLLLFLLLVSFHAIELNARTMASSGLYGADYLKCFPSHFIHSTQLNSNHFTMLGEAFCSISSLHNLSNVSCKDAYSCSLSELSCGHPFSCVA